MQRDEMGDDSPIWAAGDDVESHRLYVDAVVIGQDGLPVFAENGKPVFGKTNQIGVIEKQLAERSGSQLADGGEGIH